MLAEEIQAALSGQRRIAIVIARAGRVGEGVIGFIPMAGIGFVHFFHLSFEASHHLMVDPAVALSKMAKHRPF